TAPAPPRGPWPAATSPYRAECPADSTARRTTAPPALATAGPPAARPEGVREAVPTDAGGDPAPAAEPAMETGPHAVQPRTARKVGAVADATHHGWYYEQSAAARCESALRVASG